MVPATTRLKQAQKAPTKLTGPSLRFLLPPFKVKRRAFEGLFAREEDSGLTALPERISDEFQADLDAGFPDTLYLGKPRPDRPGL